MADPNESNAIGNPGGAEGGHEEGDLTLTGDNPLSPEISPWQLEMDGVPVDEDGNPIEEGDDTDEGEKGGFSEEMRKMKSDSDKRASQYEKTIDKLTSLVENSQTQIGDLTKKLSDKTEMVNLETHDETPQEKVNKEVEDILANLDEEETLSPMQKKVLMAQMHDLIGDAIEEAVGPLRKELETSVKPLKEQMGHQAQRSAKNTWNSATEKFVETFPEANDKRIVDSLAVKVKGDIRTNQALAQGDTDLLLKVFRQNFNDEDMVDLRDEILAEMKENEKVSDAADVIEKPGGRKGTKQRQAKSGYDAFMLARQSLGLPVND